MIAGSRPTAGRGLRARATIIAVPIMAIMPIIAACGVTGPSADDLALLDARCEEPRPEVCTQEYLPVCGLVDTGIPCVTMPCPTEAWNTYSNACTACSIPMVVGYRAGECDAAKRD